MLKQLRNKFYHWISDEPPLEEIIPFDFNRLKYEIRPGDVLLIEGRSIVSSVIRNITQSSWTHAALYIGRIIDFEDKAIQEFLMQQVKNPKPHTRLIVEGLLNKGIILSTLSQYRHHHIRICRPIGITPFDMHSVISYALRSVGTPYNVRHLLDLARFLLPWSILPRRWGSSLFRTRTGEPEPGICSSLIAEAFASIHFPILPYIKQDSDKGTEWFQRNPYLFTPKDFDVSPYFEIIKYPLFDAATEEPYYRRLPWTKSGLVSQDKGILTGSGKRDRTKEDDNEKDTDEK